MQRTGWQFVTFYAELNGLDTKEAYSRYWNGME